MNKKYWHLSQSHLNNLEKCPRQFIDAYFKQLTNFHKFDENNSTEWGSLFHRLMQQKKLNLPLTNILNQKQDLQESLSALHTAINDLCEDQDIISSEAEVKLQLKWLDKYIFTVVYDQLILKPNQAIIFDWKTYLKPTKIDYLVNNWQTKLYLFVLTEIMDYAPENISFIYWFVKLPNNPESYQINYDQKSHDKNKLELETLLSKLTTLNDESYDYDKCLNYRQCHNQCRYYSSSYSHENDDDLQLLPQTLNEVAEVEL
ncbi:MAG: PD-(D/E)XK nuclease family protein [Cyanobacterium sp. T60_A2020_053]|nr:PD-(D/E)XK nuclease family protein [Cyanobacterium sp. T60_A2020_053]